MSSMAQKDLKASWACMLSSGPIVVWSQSGSKRGADEVADKMQAESHIVKKGKEEFEETKMQVEPEEKAEKTSEAETKCEKKESEAKTAAPHKLRIGPEKHKYVYTRLTDVAYKCRRGSEYATAGHVLFPCKVTKWSVECL